MFLSKQSEAAGRELWDFSLPRDRFSDDSDQTMSKVLNTLISVSASAIGVLLFVSCAEVAGSGRYVSIPTIRVECATAGCKSIVSATAYATITTSSCNNPAFGEVVTGSTTVSCNGGFGCTGNITSFTTGSRTATSIPDGTYSICVTIDRDGNYAGTSQTGDSLGTITSNLQSSGSTVVVSSFTDL